MPETAQAESPVYTTSFDRQVALGRLGGDEELLREIAALFLDDYAVSIKALRDSVRRRDAQAVERLSHSLKGSVANFGASEAVSAAFALESAGRRGDLETASEQLAALEAALQRLRPELENLAA